MGKWNILLFLYSEEHNFALCQFASGVWPGTAVYWVVNKNCTGGALEKWYRWI